MKRGGSLVAYFVFATLTVMDGAHYICRDCGAKLAHQNALTRHNERSASCRAVRAIKAAKELARLGESGPSAVLEDDNDFDAPEGPFYDEREAMPQIIDEHALNSDSDDSDEEDSVSAHKSQVTAQLRGSLTRSSKRSCGSTRRALERTRAFQNGPGRLGSN
jgi:hypothetical protein